MITEIRSEKDRISYLFAKIKTEQDKVSLDMQPVFAGHMAIKSASFIELSIRALLANYAKNNGNRKLQNLVEYVVVRENSLNCEKIERIFDRFDKSWWKELENMTIEAERLAVDSLKDIRDQIAHGGRNGTSLNRIEEYFKGSQKFIEKAEAVVLR